MAEEEQAVRAVRLSPDDNVATLLAAVAKGGRCTIDSGTSQLGELVANEAIDFGHKVALTDLDEGDRIMKYGQPIGLATVPISRGDHVHVHNITGLRAVGISPGESVELEV